MSPGWAPVVHPRAGPVLLEGHSIPLVSLARWFPGAESPACSVPYLEAALRSISPVQESSRKPETRVECLVKDPWQAVHWTRLREAVLCPQRNQGVRERRATLRPEAPALRYAPLLRVTAGKNWTRGACWYADLARADQAQPGEYWRTSLERRLACLLMVLPELAAVLDLGLCCLHQLPAALPAARQVELISSRPPGHPGFREDPRQAWGAIRLLGCHWIGRAPWPWNRPSVSSVTQRPQLESTSLSRALPTCLVAVLEDHRPGKVCPRRDW